MASRRRSEVTRVLRRLKRGVRRRNKYLSALGLVLLAGVGQLVAASYSTGLARDVLVNLGASVLGVFLTAIALEPLIRSGSRPEEIIHSEFPHQHYIDGVGTASSRIRLMGAWPYVMDKQWRDEFLDAVRSSLNQRAIVEILILDPLSSAAEQREFDLDHTIDVSEIISEVLVVLLRTKKSLPAHLAVNFGVRVYSTLPPARLYRWDDRAICSFFPAGTGLGTDVRHYETVVAGGLGRFVDEQFETLWRHPDTLEVDDYLGIDVAVSSSEGSFHCRYVDLDRVLYVHSSELVDHLFRSGNARHVVSVPNSPYPASYTPESLGENGHLTVRVQGEFGKKYGLESPVKQMLRGVVRLSPVSEPSGLDAVTADG